MPITPVTNTTIPTTTNTTATTTTATATTTATTAATTAANAATTNQPMAPVTTVPPPVASTPAPPTMTVDGVASAVKAKKNLPTYKPQPGQLAQPGSSNNFGNGRGYIETTIAPRGRGWDIGVDVHSGKATDEVNVFVSVRITDPTNNTESWVVVGMPISDKMDGKDGTDKDGMLITKKSFYLSIDDLNAWLSKKGGKKADGSPKLKFTPGDPISLDATWQTAGHQAGGRRDQRYGYMVTPPITTGVIGIQDPNAPIVTPQKSMVTGASKPVDLTIKIPQEMLTKYAKVLAPNATFQSHREEELKFSPKTFQELKDFTLNLMRLSKLPAAQQSVELQKLFGGQQGWSVAVSDRYFQKDQSGAYQYYAKGEKVWKVKDDKGESDFDFEGLPKVLLMKDSYTDTIEGPPRIDGANDDDDNGWHSNFEVANANGAVRFRDGEFKNGQVLPTMGQLEVKPGGGVVDPYSLTATRLEYAVETNPGIIKDPAAMAQMADFLKNGPSPYNPMRELQKVASGVDGDAVKNNILDNEADRFKFNLEHSSGLKVEISCDFPSFTSKSLAVEAPSTKGKSVEEKYAHWEQEFQKAGLAFDKTPGAVNKGTFVEYAQNGLHRVEVRVEVSIDKDSNKAVSEILNTKGKQVEIEMEHAQIRSNAPVQTGTAAASTSKDEPSTEAEEDTFFKALSDDCIFAGPPTIHNVEDLKDPELYTDSSYLQMREAGIFLQDWGFQGGVNRTRQKAAYALEMMGQIEPLALPRLQWQVEGDPKAAEGLEIQTWTPGQVVVTGDKLTSGKPFEATMTMEGFPIKLKLQGTETSAQVKDLIEAEMKKFKLWKPDVTTGKGSVWDDKLKKDVDVPEFTIKLALK